MTDRRTVAAPAVLVLVLGISIAQVIAPSVAVATPEDERRAAESFQQGEVAFARKEYEKAAVAFEIAGTFAPHPSAYLNAAEAWEKAGDFARAAQACARALEIPNADGSFHAEANKRLAALAPRVARVDIVGPAKMRVRIDASDPFVAPTTRYLAPGRHEIVATDPDSSASRSIPVDLAAGAAQSVDVTPADPNKKEPPPSRPLVPLGTWVSFGIAGAGAVVVGVLGGLTVDAQSGFEEAPTRDAADRFYDLRLGTNVALGVTLAAAVAGAVVWIVDAATAPKPPKTSIAPWFEPGAGAGAGAVLVGSF